MIELESKVLLRLELGSIIERMETLSGQLMTEYIIESPEVFITDVREALKEYDFLNKKLQEKFK